MGLRGFGPWLRSTFPSAFTSLPNHYHDLLPAPYNHCHIDVNTLLYTFARQTASSIKVLNCTANHLHWLLSMRTRPTQRLLLAIDGAASVPKLAVQRQRRRQNGEKAERDGLFDCRQFTPGCLFMGDFGGILRDWSKKWFSSKILPDSCTVVIDPVTRMGEGEHKIIHDLYKYSRAGDRIAIVSTDSDLFLYPLLLPTDRHIDIYLPFMDTFNVLSINRLRELIMQDTKSDNLIDVIILALLSGNDYVPAVPWATLRTTYPNYVSFVKSGRYSGPFYSVSKQRFYANNLRSFLKHHHQNLNAFNYKPSVAENAQDYLQVLSWTVQQMANHTAFHANDNKLADMQTPNGINLESLLEADYAQKLPPTTSIDYIPGAIGLSLLSPDQGGRHFLPEALQDCESPEQASWWAESAPGPLLQHYNQLIGSVRDRMTDRERIAVDPGKQEIVTASSHLLKAS